MVAARRASLSSYRAPDIFETNAYLPPNFLLNADFQNFKWYFHPLYFFAMLKIESITVFKRVSAVLYRLKYGFGSDLLLFVVHFLY